MLGVDRALRVIHLTKKNLPKINFKKVAIRTLIIFALGSPIIFYEIRYSNIYRSQLEARQLLNQQGDNTIIGSEKWLGLPKLEEGPGSITVQSLPSESPQHSTSSIR